MYTFQKSGEQLFRDRHSTHWKIVLLAWLTTFAQILISLSWTLLSDQCDTLLGRASRRRKFPRLYARTNKERRTWLAAKLQSGKAAERVQDYLVQLRAYLPSFVHCLQFPSPL